MAKVEGRYYDPTSYKINTSVGDGSTTIFNLTHEPIGLAVLEVKINGVTRKTTEDYALSEKQVTFTFAPANAQDIEFNYIKK